MELQILLCILAVLVLVTLFWRCDRQERFTYPTGICLQASQYGADSAFLDSCAQYQGLCGEASTSVVVHQINGEFGLNSDQADSAMQTSLSLAHQKQCCDPNNQDSSACTGNTD